MEIADADKAFENERLTPEYILQLQALERLHTPPIPWKKDMLNIPLIRHIQETPYGVKVCPAEPMRHDTSDPRQSSRPASLCGAHLSQV
jgi:hypothetical protein